MSAQENERKAASTTLAGERSCVAVPRGIEVLVNKAAVDSEFRELLLSQRGAAAAAIKLKLDPAESAILNAIPREQLVQVVSQTTVPLEQRRVFLGRIAAAMLAALGASLTGCTEIGSVQSAGIRPVNITTVPSRGIQPDRPETDRSKFP